jgi:hypothetical protein
MTDTGPPYPAPDPTSNEIGKFTVGVSPAGTIPPFDVWITVISQFANSPILTALITNFATAIDQTTNFDNFFDLIIDVDTAVGYGLDVWGRIVGVNRILTVPNVLPFFGFEEATDACGFNQGPFYSGQFVTTNFVLDDNAYRRLILVKAFANISQCSIPNLNQMLLTLFPGRGNAYVTENPGLGPWFGFEESTDGLGFNQAQFFNGILMTVMVMTYTFEFALSPLELAIVQNSGVLPKPTGVAASVVIDA